MTTTDAILSLLQHASGFPDQAHRNAGQCPDWQGNPYARDPLCPLCQAMMALQEEYTDISPAQTELFITPAR